MRQVARLALDRRLAVRRAVVEGDMCFVAGTTGYDPVTKVLPEDVSEQTRNCFKVIASALRDGGFEMTDLVRATYYVTDAKDFDAVFDSKAYGLMHFNAVFDNPLTMLSIWNTLKVGVITAVLGGILAFAIGYTVTRTNVKGRGAIDLVSTIPIAIPGLVIGVAYLWAWIGLPGGLYGTIWILALAFVARFIPDTVKSLSTSFMQIHKELEEAAWISGRGMLSTIATIVLPLARPGVVASMTLIFVLAVRELGSSLFLYTSDSTVMAVLLLDYYEGGNTGKTAAFSLVQTVILGVLLGITHWLSRGSAQGAARSG